MNPKSYLLLGIGFNLNWEYDCICSDSKYNLHLSSPLLSDLFDAHLGQPDPFDLWSILEDQENKQTDNKEQGGLNF